MSRKFLFSFLILFLLVSLSACASRDMTTNNSPYIKEPIKNNGNGNNNNNSKNNMNQEILKEYSQAEFQTNLGNFTIEFFNDKMPITVSNFLSLAQDGYFDEIKFHRIIDGFMIQGGDPLTKNDDMMTLWGTGGPGYAIPDEHVLSPELTNTYGTISMANSGPNSGGSQFFINVADNSFLDFDKHPISSKHPVFGKVVSGINVIEKIAKVKTGQNDRPVDPVIIKKIDLK